MKECAQSTSARFLQMPGVNEVHVWHTNPEEYLECIQSRCFLEWLSSEEYERYHSFLIAHALVRSVLSCYATAHPKDLKFNVGEYGKPELLHPFAGLQVRFNLSYTTGLVICAITKEYAVGVDVECLSRRINFEVVEECFAVQETLDLRRVGERERRKMFFEYWTLKEAYVKAHGKGLSIPLNDFWFHRDCSGEIRVSFSPRHIGDALQWQFFLVDEVSAEHQVALAIQHSNRIPLNLCIRDARQILLSRVKD
jgi:4'-phosphopantetheinyl transferase